MKKFVYPVLCRKCGRMWGCSCASFFQRYQIGQMKKQPRQSNGFKKKVNPDYDKLRGK